VDIETLNEKGIKVARVPTYSPESVAEHSVALAMALNRNLVRAHNRVMQGNYTLSGLIGMEICRKTVGIIGTGAIGACAARIWHGFGAKVLAFDIKQNPELVEKGIVEYRDYNDVVKNADILSLHCPLNSKTFHILDKDGIAKMKDDAMLVNTSRGGLVDTSALVDALESGKVGGAAMDVYENEGALFFQDFSQYTHQDRQKMNAFDRQFQLLISFPNVIVTPHIAFLTTEALHNIAETTVDNLKEFALGKKLTNEVTPQS
jgi:D-lactate dehydrogenase